jgi:putative hydrolase of the HAD superfamily
MPIRAVIFDADGVLIFPWRFAQYLEREHGITPGMTRGFFRGIFEDCLTGKADLKDVLPPFLSQWGWEGTVDGFVKTWLEVEDAVDERLVKVIRALRQSGLICCLATSQERYRAEYMTTVMGFSEVLDRLFFSHSLGCQKPDHAYYRLIEEALEVEGSSILFWDDSAVNVASAREFGWHAEVYTDFQDLEEKLAAHLGRGEERSTPWPSHSSA